MDLLACPIDKDWPLKLEIIEQENEIEEVSIPHLNSKTNVVCNFYCAFKNFLLVEEKNGKGEVEKHVDIINATITEVDCKKCFQIEIIKGRLYCKRNDTHKYEIKEGIPVMLTEEQIKEIYGKKK